MKTKMSVPVMVWVVVLIGVGAVPARAAMPVIDIRAIAQAIQQVQSWKSQLAGMTNQLNQLRSQYQAITGTRGMQNLLKLTPAARNYLPPSWSELLAVANGASGSYAGLSSKVRAAISANAILSSADLARLSPTQRARIEEGRKAAALVQVMSQRAYEGTSERFTALQGLIDSIGRATDQKAIDDLTARIGSEQAMLANEQAKLVSLAQMTEADREARRQRERETVLKGIGSASALPAVSY